MHVDRPQRLVQLATALHLCQLVRLQARPGGAFLLEAGDLGELLLDLVALLDEGCIVRPKRGTRTAPATTAVTASSAAASAAMPPTTTPPTTTVSTAAVTHRAAVWQLPATASPTAAPGGRRRRDRRWPGIFRLEIDLPPPGRLQQLLLRSCMPEARSIDLSHSEPFFINHEHHHCQREVGIARFKKLEDKFEKMIGYMDEREQRDEEAESKRKKIRGRGNNMYSSQ